MASKKTKTVVPILLIIIFLVIVLAFKVKKNHEYDLVITSDSLLNVITQKAQLIEPTVLAGWQETNQEKFVLIDIRSQHNYNVGHIENAINISFNDIIDNQWKALFLNPEYKKILYCDFDINSNEAWMLLSQLGYKNIFVLEGGIKYWKAYIKDSYAPFSNPSYDEHPLYDYSKEMKKAGSAPETNTQEETIAPLPVTNNKKESVEGGCG